MVVQVQPCATIAEARELKLRVNNLKKVICGTCGVTSFCWLHMHWTRVTVRAYLETPLYTPFVKISIHFVSFVGLKSIEEFANAIILPTAHGINPVGTVHCVIAYELYSVKYAYVRIQHTEHAPPYARLIVTTNKPSGMRT